jgi:stearoyl-CoA desaturase (delta-9 desaturase)
MAGPASELDVMPAAGSERPDAPAPRQRIGRTLRSVALRRSQRLHAFGITVIPLAGTVLAIIRAAAQGVVAVEVVLFLVMYVLTMLGMTVGLHRMLSHLAFVARPAPRAILTILGAMSVQGPPVYWVANHRRHHQSSDDPGDPHSPRYDGEHELSGVRAFWHAHIGWMFTHELTNPLYYCRDLLRDPIVSSISRRYYLWVAIGMLVPAAVGGLAAGSWDGALGGLLWGGLVRVLFSGHATSCINSVTHMFGSREFATSDSSRNTWWLAIPTLGESWHNNHHAFPGAAIFGHRWIQIDVGGYVISSLERLGLVSAVCRPSIDKRNRLHEAIRLRTGARPG